MTLASLYIWHYEQAERFARLATEHKTSGPRRMQVSVSKRYVGLAEFHSLAAEAIKPFTEKQA